MSIEKLITKTWNGIRSRDVFLCEVHFIVRGKLDLCVMHSNAYCLRTLDRLKAKVETRNKMLCNYQAVCAKQMDGNFNVSASKFSPFQIFIRV
jgi:hypothetical protein